MKNEKVINNVHYVYKIVDLITGEFYIGSRSCKCKVEDDCYMGSYYTWKPDDNAQLVKEIIKSDFNTRDEAVMHEADLIKKCINDKLNKNYHIPIAGFHSHGRVSVKDEYGNTFSIDITDERYISGELKAVACDTVPVIDADGNRFRISKNDERYINGEVWVDYKPLSEEAKRKISKTLKGHSVSDETRKLQSKNNGRYWKGKKRPDISEKLKQQHKDGIRSTEHLQFKRSNETKRKMSEWQKGKLSPVAKAVLQFSKESDFIKRWDCIADAKRALGAIHISCCCRGKVKTAGGYIWKYETNTNGAKA